jgi:hypothetical protein
VKDIVEYEKTELKERDITALKILRESYNEETWT